MLRVVVASILSACVVDAWLPQDRGDLAAFNQTRRYEELGKRSNPSLPNGVSKIRGVNFGGMRRGICASFLSSKADLLANHGDQHQAGWFPNLG
jgi:hypothetical protein